MKIAVLASGNGSNFEVIAQAIKDKKNCGGVGSIIFGSP